MGKGDKKTKRGKIFQGSFGVRRPKDKVPAADKAALRTAKPKEVKEPVPAKAPKAAASAKKEPKAKKQEEAAE
jgi:30S ribosomal protein S31